MGVDAGEDCSADGMVGAADGAWHNAKGRFRVEGEILRVGEECTGEDCCHACVLHADFNGDGALLGGVEFEQTTDIVAEYVAEAVMQKHHGEDERDKAKAVREKLRANGYDNATND